MMADFTVVPCDALVESQQQRITRKALNCDRRDLRLLVKGLSELRVSSAHALKTFDGTHTSQGGEQNSLQGTIVKIESVVKGIGQNVLFLERRCRDFQSLVDNRDFEKSEEQHFFRKTLRGYDERRLGLKKYILEHEKKMQVVEDEVRRNMQYETHRFTAHNKQLDIERLELQYSNKMDAASDLTNCVDRYLQLKRRVREAVLKKRKVEIGKAVQKQQKEQKGLKVEFPDLQKSYMSCTTSFTLCTLTKAWVFNANSRRALGEVVKMKRRLFFENQRLKAAKDKIKERMEEESSSMVIIEDLYRSYFGMWRRRVTKTDYLIHLRQLETAIAGKMKQFGLHYEYSNCEQKLKRPKSHSLSKLLPLTCVASKGRVQQFKNGGIVQ